MYLNIFSRICRSSLAFKFVPVFLSILLMTDQRLSTFCVWTLEFEGETKFRSCITRLWVYPYSASRVYAAHPSEMMWVPGNICILIKLVNVCLKRINLIKIKSNKQLCYLFLLATFWIKNLSECPPSGPRSMAPTTQISSTRRPRLYFRFETNDSSISTIFPIPPSIVSSKNKSHLLFLSKRAAIDWRICLKPGFHAEFVS